MVKHDGRCAFDGNKMVKHNVRCEFMRHGECWGDLSYDHCDLIIKCCIMYIYIMVIGRLGESGESGDLK